jgi:hypothetical protein
LVPERAAKSSAAERSEVMLMFRKQSPVVVLTLALVACSSTQQNESPAPAPAPDAAAIDGGSSGDPPAAKDPAAEAASVALAAKLAQWLTGRFDSKDQAARDGDYREISLEICEVSSALGPRSLYVEQAVIGTAPYRQRLYVIEAIDGSSARSLVYELQDPKAAIGLCARTQKPSFKAEDAVPRPGCYVEMYWVDDHFQGHTPDHAWDGNKFVPNPDGERCASSLQGASYAASSVELRQELLRSWDQGFDAKGKQVWGATKGGYEFVRRDKLGVSR